MLNKKRFALFPYDQKEEFLTFGGKRYLRSIKNTKYRLRILRLRKRVRLPRRKIKNKYRRIKRKQRRLKKLNFIFTKKRLVRKIKLNPIHKTQLHHIRQIIYKRSRTYIRHFRRLRKRMRATLRSGYTPRTRNKLKVPNKRNLQLAQKIVEYVRRR